MSQWKVSKEKIEIFTHTNSDNLCIGKVGSYQVVVQKGLYNDGDEVVFAPEKSVLTGDIKSEYEKYLVGPDKNRVKGMRLRGEISSGIIIPKSLIPGFETLEVGEDISESVGISKYEPPIPTQLAGKVKSFDMPFVGSHDCEHVGIYVNDLIDGERVVITSKIHGSQVIYALNVDSGEEIISSKGLLKRGLVIEESDDNFYWKGVKNTNIRGIIENHFKSGVIQIFGEVVPIQDGFTYGFENPHILIFDVRCNGLSIPYDKVCEGLKNLWVPVVFDGNLELIRKEIVLYSDPIKGIHNTKPDYTLPKWIQEIAEVKERVSGSSLHIEEGVVIRPYIDRNGRDGTPLRLKVISKLYRETGEEIN